MYICLQISFYKIQLTRTICLIFHFFNEMFIGIKIVDKLFKVHIFSLFAFNHLSHFQGLGVVEKIHLAKYLHFWSAGIQFHQNDIIFKKTGKNTIKLNRRTFFLFSNLPSHNQSSCPCNRIITSLLKVNYHFCTGNGYEIKKNFSMNNLISFENWKYKLYLMLKCLHIRTSKIKCRKT